MKTRPRRISMLAIAAQMMPDGLHPNDAGTPIMAMAFADLF